MPKLKIQCQTSMNANDAFSKVSDLLNSDEQLRKLDHDYSCDFDPNNLTGKAKGSLFSADMKVEEDGSGANVEIIVDLPLKLALMKGVIEKTLHSKLDKALA